MQQSTACLQFAWRTTSLRVGGRAARRSCLRRGGGGRQAGATVSGVAVRTDRQTSAFCVGVRPAVALRRPTQTQNAPVWSLSDSVHTATPDTTQTGLLRRVWCELSRPDRQTGAFV